MPNRQATLESAVAALSTGRPAVASALLQTYLATNARDVDARYLYARSLAACGAMPAAVGEFRQILTMQPNHANAVIDLGIALAFSGSHREALAVLERVTASVPRPPEVEFARGLSHLGVGDLPAAEDDFRAAIARGLRIPEVHDSLGATLFRAGRYHESIECFRQAIALNPAFAAARTNLGDALIRIGDTNAAIDAYRGAVALAPEDASVHAVLGTALLIANDCASAVVCLERAVSLGDRMPDVAVNLGTALRRLGQDARAEAAYRRALDLKSDHAEALLELGVLAAEQYRVDEAVSRLLAARDQQPAVAKIVLKAAQTLEQLGCRREALDVIERAAVTIPDDPQIHDFHGRLLHGLGRYGAALECYARALELDAGRRATQLNRGHALEAQGDIPEAIRCFQRVLEETPDDQSAIAGLASCAFRICAWGLADASVARLRDIPHGIDQLHPFLRFAADLDPVMLAESCARTAGAIAAQTDAATIPPYAHTRLRVAHLSPDFRQHPVAHAIIGMLEQRDRGAMEVIGVALTAPDESDVARRLTACFDEFLDCSTMSDREIVALLRRREIDIAVDLAGFTSGGRPHVFAARVAPVQVNFLGFAGSTGARCMDFLIADEVVVPREDEPLYAETVVRLPHSYLPFDNSRAIDQAIDRVGAGLPATGVVFCGFSNGYKISREMFAVWLSLLAEVPGSVLWLRGGHASMETNLRVAADDAGVARERLVFAPFVADIEAHLGRLRLADMFLDTLPYNAHTTALEALWAGVPVITCRGRSFAGRVGASVLEAAGLPELVCANLPAYHELAARLARSPADLAQLRDKVARARHTAGAFDTARYARDFEAALRGMARGLRD